MDEHIEQLQKPDIQTLLEENLKVSKETNRILHAMRRDAFIGGLVKLLFWVVIIVGSFWLTVQYLQPLLSSFSGTDVKNIDYQALINQYQAQFGK